MVGLLYPPMVMLVTMVMVVMMTVRRQGYIWKLFQVHSLPLLTHMYPLIRLYGKKYCQE